MNKWLAALSIAISVAASAWALLVILANSAPIALVRLDLTGQSITEPLVISSDTSITGSFSIVGEGQIVIEGGSATIHDARISWQSTEAARKAAIVQRGGRLLFEGNEVTIAPQPWLNNHEGVSQFFLRVDPDGRPGGLIVNDNELRAESTYGSGFVWVEDVAKFTDIRVTFNRVSGLHAGIYLNGSRGAVIADNVLTKVSLGNIVTDRADDLLIERNRIVFHGDGTSGDGLTIVGGNDILIRRNVILMGTCYGIQMMPADGEPMRGIAIRGNTISDGITSALYLHGTDDNFIEDVLIQGNALSGNMGWGLLGTYLSGVRVTRNVFTGNAPTVEAQHVLGAEVEIAEWEDNLAGVPFDPSSLPGRHLKVNEPYPL